MVGLVVCASGGDRMPRAGQRRPPTGERLSDRIAIGVLPRAYPPALVDRVVAEAGVKERRHRLLPARVVVYYVLAMCLFSQVGYEEVARLLTEGLAWARRWRGSWQVPTAGAIARARARLGAEPLQALFAQAVRPLATSAAEGARCRGWRLASLDGTTVDVADTPTNAAAFGRPRTHRGERAALYAERWELETALDELKTHQRGPKVVLRSRSPEMVTQEVWGMLLVHHAIRRLMHQAALDHHLDPDRLSFVRSLRVVRRQVTRQAGVSPSAPGQSR